MRTQQKTKKRILSTMIVLAITLTSGNYCSTVLASDPDETITAEETDYSSSRQLDQSAGVNDEERQNENAPQTLLKDTYKISFAANGQEKDSYTAVYTGEEVTPEIIVKNENDETDILDIKSEDSIYAVEYSDNINVGTATVEVYRKDDKDKTDVIESTFTITPASIENASVKLSASTYTYDGGKKTPQETVTYAGKKLEKGTDYTVSYTNNIQIGTASVKITGEGNYTGSISANFKIVFGSVKLTSIKTSYNALTVNWSKVPGAEKYVIYRSTKKNSGYKALKTITGNSTVSYKNTGLTTGKTYYYKVRAYKGTTYTQSAVKSCRVQPSQASITKVSSQSYNSVKISWKKVAGASGYYIYRSTSKNGTYKKIGTVTKGSTLSYKVTKLTTGKTYYYKVCAYRKVKSKKYSGSKSAAMEGKALLGKVSITKNSYKSGKAALQWKTVKGASGYEIYRSTNKTTGYTKVKTLSKSGKSWSNSGLSGGKTYYYKIRAYRTVSGKKVYGSFSAVKSVQVPVSKWDKLLNQYKNNTSVDQLIFVKYKGGSKADIYVYDKQENGWKNVLKCDGYVGKNGINKVKAGDKKTPTGTFGITGAFGIKSKPVTSLDYTKVNKYLYWCGDKKYYNQLIDIRKQPHTCHGEHLIDYTGSYNYGLFLDFNSSNTYGKGSAIFMHCTKNYSHTAGCISVSESNMLKILKMIDDGAKICIYPE